MFHYCRLACLLLFILAPLNVARGKEVVADLLIVGGTESGCAAAIQAARMGVRRIVLVNDIEWLGGQFSAEGLGAIDENRAHGYDGSVPIPRSGIFRDLIDRIEDRNAEQYGGVRRPGNTRVITTSRPADSERVFRGLLAPFEKRRQVERFSNYRVDSAIMAGNRVAGVTFRSSRGQEALQVKATLTIDASDWGDVIQSAGAAWEAGVDAKSKYDEPSAPEIVEAPNDMNPMTWCMILEGRPTQQLIGRPRGYDPKYFNGLWGWIDEPFAYTSRRLVDGQGSTQFDHPDVLLVNAPPIDYPLDRYPDNVAKALERTEAGASGKNIVGMTPEQREIVFADAKLHSLKYLYHLQQRFAKFRNLSLSDEFGTTDHLPPKPYIRESLRLKAMHVVCEQEVLGFGSRSNYATTMFPDAVFSWQFELDFHPTKRHWTTEQASRGAWEAAFRGNRRFGRGGTGRCVFPLRAMIPIQVQGLLGAQKNLGYTSIVGSSCRLHDQSMHAGQAAGAVAAVAILQAVEPAAIVWKPDLLALVWDGLLSKEQGAPLVIWPFADMDPFDSHFEAVQQLALRRLLSLGPADTSFDPERVATLDWLKALRSRAKEEGYDLKGFGDGSIVQTGESRAAAAGRLWETISTQPARRRPRMSPDDADGDQILDRLDALPFTPGSVSWDMPPELDGLPAVDAIKAETKAFNFTSKSGASVERFSKDFGAAYHLKTGYGWRQDLTANTRLRGLDAEPIRDGFVFTRRQDVWECELANGMWRVVACLGDAGHEQTGQCLVIEGNVVASNVETAAGNFHEFESTVEIQDGKLTVVLGKPAGGSNTCINWLIATPVQP